MPVPSITAKEAFALEEINTNRIPKRNADETNATRIQNDTKLEEEETNEILEYNMYIDFMNASSYDTTPNVSDKDTQTILTETNNTYPDINDDNFLLEPPMNINSRPVIKYGKAKKIYARKFVHQSIFLDITQKEPIIFSVLLKNKLKEEFFVFLTQERALKEPFYLIHVGGGGTNCSIHYNDENFVNKPCTLFWRENAKLKFWIWTRGSYNHGEMSIASEQENPIEHGPLVTLKVPFPVEVSYVAFSPANDEVLTVYLY